VPLIVVTGLPGSGKSTISNSLADRLALPLIAKDRFKEILFDTLGTADMAWSQRIGAAAIALQYDVMSSVSHAVVDSALWTDRSEPELVALQRPMIQVFCDCPFELARYRFFARVGDAALRHRGFSEGEMSEEDYDRFKPLREPLRLQVPLVRLDTSSPLNNEALDAAERIVRAAVSTATVA
jgi:predicted kinase